MSDRIGAFVNGIPVFFIGMGVVFAVLALLIFSLILLGKIMNSKAEKEKEKVVFEKNQAQDEVAATIENEVLQDETELVAVITAVIAASLGTTSDALQVRSLRKVQRKSL